MIAPIDADPAAGPAQAASQAAIERMLMDEGFAIDHADDAAEAARRFATDEHDLVILTHDHPHATLGVMTGARAVHNLRVRAAQEGRRYVPVLMMSSAPEQAALSEAKSLGADDVLPLTTLPQVALHRVRAYLALSGRGERRAHGSSSAALSSGVRGGHGPSSSGLAAAATPAGQPVSLSMRHDLTQRLVHDLRNPLAGLSSNLAYVDDHLAGGTDPEVLEALADCRAAVGRLRRAATMLVDLGRLEEGTLEPRRVRTQVPLLVQDIFSQRQHEAHLRDLKLVAEIPPGLSAAIDPEVTGRLVHALLDHALRYAEAGSTVLLRAGLMADSAQRSAAPNHDRLVLEMIADGEWLPKSERSHIGRGATSSVLGAGLGLHYANLVAHAHCSHLEIHEAPGGAAPRTSLSVIL